MTKQSLQIKRNKEIFTTKEGAIKHLNSLVEKLDDGEIVLCRYFNGETIQTLVGFETKYEITDPSTNEKDIVAAIAYVDSFNQMGKGFYHDANDVLQLNLGDGLNVDKNNKIQIVLGQGLEIKSGGKVDVKINPKVTNFLTVDNDGLKVDDIDTNATKTTEKILVMGGPLATDAVKQEIISVFGTDEDDNPIIPENTDLQTLLVKLFCKEMYPTITSDNSVSGTVSSQINAPTITLSNSATTLEVGTYISATTISFNGNSYVVSTNSQVSGMTYGYSTRLDDSRDSSDNNIIRTPTSGIVTTSIAKMSCQLSGFTQPAFAEMSGTSTSTLSKTNYNLGQITEGNNKILINITGQTISYQIAEIPSVYPCSNIGKTSSACKTTKVNAISGTLTAPTNNAQKSITGVRYGFYGYVSDTFVINPTNLRNLTPLTNPNTSSFIISGKNIVRTIVALPSTWGKTIDTVTDNKSLNAIVTDAYKLQTTTEYKVAGANGYEPIIYDVYVYDPTDKKDDFKHTITLK